ncbi:homeodomain-like protein [Tanacetum coccineum]
MATRSLVILKVVVGARGGVVTRTVENGVVRMEILVKRQELEHIVEQVTQKRDDNKEITSKGNNLRKLSRSLASNSFKPHSTQNKNVKSDQRSNVIGMVNSLDFSVSNAWEAIRPSVIEVGWFRIVWFPHCIPRHPFHLWLVMRKSLKTHDNLRPWDVGLDLDINRLRCPFCDLQPDSHTHLFFECSFSSQVWRYVRHLANMDAIPSNAQDIVAHLHPISNKRTTKSIIGKLVLAASSYFIWIERNNRLFKKIRRPPEEIRDLIMVIVRLKLVSFTFKNKDNVNRLHDRWKMPSRFRLYGN